VATSIEPPIESSLTAIEYKPISAIEIVLASWFTSIVLDATDYPFVTSGESTITPCSNLETVESAILFISKS